MKEFIELIQALGQVVTPFVAAWIAVMTFKQGRKQTIQGDKQDVVIEKMNGMTSALITAEKSESNQAGNKEGRAELKQELKEEKEKE